MLTSKETCKDKLADITSNLYPTVRNEVLDAEALCGRAFSGIWMRPMRNGFDRLCSGVSKLETGDHQGALDALTNSERLLYFAHREAWLECASLLCAELDRNVKSIWTGGNKAAARRSYNSALTLISQGRREYTTDREEGIARMKQAAYEAKDGLIHITNVSQVRSLTFIAAIVGGSIILGLQWLFKTYQSSIG